MSYLAGLPLHWLRPNRRRRLAFDLILEGPAGELNSAAPRCCSATGPKERTTPREAPLVAQTVRTIAAYPPAYLTAIPSWKPGDEFLAGSELVKFRIVAIDEPPSDEFQGLFTVQTVE